MTVADEAYGLYPEHPQNLARVADQPEHRFFRRYGESMPEGDWRHPGTKQGIYMIGPDAEYLEGRFAATDPDDVRRRLQRALERWKELRAEKGYRNRPVPRADMVMPPRVSERRMVLKVSLRDLPRDGDPTQCQRYRPDAFEDRRWGSFMEWAWNRNWIGFDDPAAFLPGEDGDVALPAALVHRLYREILVDNVRGQAPHWRPEHIEDATLTARRVEQKGDRWTIEYRGRARMDAGEQGYIGELYGRAVWNDAAERFERFELVALGNRRGAWRFNQRAADPGPAPIGIALRLAR